LMCKIKNIIFSKPKKVNDNNPKCKGNICLGEIVIQKNICYLTGQDSWSFAVFMTIVVITSFAVSMAFAVFTRIVVITSFVVLISISRMRLTCSSAIFQASCNILSQLDL